MDKTMGQIGRELVDSFAQAKALQDDPESLAAQARLLVAEAERRGYQAGLKAGRLAVMSEMIANPNPN